MSNLPPTSIAYFIGFYNVLTVAGAIQAIYFSERNQAYALYIYHLSGYVAGLFYTHVLPTTIPEA